MFYTTDANDHGLPHDPFKAIVAPRPISWISSISAKGEINLAPYSYFNGVSSRPPVVCFSSGVDELRAAGLTHAGWCARRPFPRGWSFTPHQGVFDRPRPHQDLLWKIVIPASETTKVLRLLDRFNLNVQAEEGTTRATPKRAAAGRKSSNKASQSTTKRRKAG